jgi:hypothetical protein
VECSNASPFWAKGVASTLISLRARTLKSLPMTAGSSPIPAWIVALAATLMPDPLDRYVIGPSAMTPILECAQKQVIDWMIKGDIHRQFDLAEIFCGAGGLSRYVEEMGGSAVRFDRPGMTRKLGRQF